MLELPRGLAARGWAIVDLDANDPQILHVDDEAADFSNIGIGRPVHP